METLHNPQASTTRETLLGAALLCFAEYGYEATSIRLVASMAGRNTSLINYYFGNKEGLYREVIMHLCGHLPRAFPADGFPATTFGTPEERLRAFIRWSLSSLECGGPLEDAKQAAAQRLLVGELHFPKDQVRDLLQARFGTPIRELREIIHAIRPDLEAGEVDFWGLTVLACCLSPLYAAVNRQVWPELKPTLDLDAQAERFTHLIYLGLASPLKPPVGCP